MKQLDLTPYNVGAGEGATTEPYPLRDSLMNIVFAAPGAKARELLARDDLARKIRDCVGSPLELTEAEASQLVTAVEAVQGYGRHDVELVRRVLDLAPATP